MMVEEETWRFFSVYFDLWTLRCSSSYLVKQEIYFNIKRFFKKSNWIDESLSDENHLHHLKLLIFGVCCVNGTEFEEMETIWIRLEHAYNKIYLLSKQVPNECRTRCFSIEETIKAICSEVNVFNSLSYRSHSKTP